MRNIALIFVTALICFSCAGLREDTKCEFTSKVYRGRIVGEVNNRSIPIVNARVAMTRKSKADTVAASYTNKDGEFELRFKGREDEYKLHVITPDNKAKNILLTTLEGKEISWMDPGEGGFTYHLLPSHLVLLSEYGDEDIEFKYNNFITAGGKQMTTSHIIYYEFGKSHIKKESLPLLDKIVDMLKTNPDVKLDVNSHTDVIGEEQDNQKLSELRAAAVIKYLRSKGIPTERLTAMGKGEKEIVNRCKEGVDCLDCEHGYNRRTEFRFSKAR